MKQFLLTPAMGKRLIGRAVAEHPEVLSALKTGTVVIVAGTTNAYVAEEVLASVGQQEGFCRKGFRRGLVVPPGTQTEKIEFPGDVVLVKGKWQKGQTIFDVVGDLKCGDVILKGANAVNIAEGKAGVYIGHPESGTIGAALPVVVGRRVKLLVPVGLEKRVSYRIDDIAAMVNAPGCEGPRMMPVPGEVVTELDAVEMLTGVDAWLVAGGGVCGAEGSVWLAIDGEDADLSAATDLIQSLASEPPCEA